jgi:hypothetical protein
MRFSYCVPKKFIVIPRQRFEVKEERKRNVCKHIHKFESFRKLVENLLYIEFEIWLFANSGSIFRIIFNCYPKTIEE